MTSTRLRQHVDAPRAAVYRVLLDPAAIPRWRVPEGMRCVVHEWNAREGGTLRVSLTYDAPTGSGKSSAHTDTYRGRFAELVPNERVVEVDEFESADPALQGPMRSTITLTDAPGGGTDVEAVHEDLPPGLSPADNEIGWRMALEKLARLLEQDAGRPGS